MAARVSMLLYGANGYTGRLIAENAAAYGIEPVLAGRSPAIGTLAASLGLASRVFGLSEPRSVAAALHDVEVVLNCAGPFIHTAVPLAEACIQRGAHYIDVTGEIAVIEALAARGAAARAARVMLLPAAGFDVVPTDCLALHLKQRLPSADRLMLGLRSRGRLSRGTKTTMVEHQHRGGMVRRAGRLTRVPSAWRRRLIDFGDGAEAAVTIPWGDVATAFYTTGIPNIEVYAVLSSNRERLLRLSRYLGWLGSMAPVKRLATKRARSGLPGPTPEERAQGHTTIWGRVEDRAGHSAEARLHGPEGYTLTLHAALRTVQRVVAGAAAPGFQTPAGLFGADFVLELPGVQRVDVPSTVATR